MLGKGNVCWTAIKCCYGFSRLYLYQSLSAAIDFQLIVVRFVAISHKKRRAVYHDEI